MLSQERVEEEEEGEEEGGDGVGGHVIPHAPVGLRAPRVRIYGLLVLLGQGQAGLPDPRPDRVCVTVPLPGEVGRADHVLHALGDDLLPLLGR